MDGKSEQRLYTPALIYPKMKSMPHDSELNALIFQCFKCGSRFNHDLESACADCGFDKCPVCGCCYCSLDEDERKVADAIFYSLPDWLGA
jgi:hypothetical protein